MSAPEKIVLVSGWAMPAATLLPMAQALGRSFDVQTVSLSQLAPVASAYAAGLSRLIETRSSSCALIGWSTGGLAALEAAAGLTDRISGLVLISSTARFCADPGYPWGVPRSQVRVMAQTLSRKFEETLRPFHTDAGRPGRVEPDVLESRLAAARAEGRSALGEGLKYLQQADARPALGRLRIPTLILHGRSDAIIPWQAGQYLHDSIPGSHWVLYEAVGHDLPVRQPEPVARAIEDFLENLH